MSSTFHFITIRAPTELLPKWQDGRALEKRAGLNDVSLRGMELKNLFLGVTRLAWVATTVPIHVLESITCEPYHMSLEKRGNDAWL